MGVGSFCSAGVPGVTWSDIRYSIVGRLVGNALGKRLRAATSPRALERVEIATVLAGAALALAGAA